LYLASYGSDIKEENVPLRSMIIGANTMIEEFKKKNCLSLTVKNYPKLEGDGPAWRATRQGNLCQKAEVTP
jgi:hypothetical protein